MKKTLFISALLLLMSISTKGQIGYQVSLLNSATGEPRANENVTVKIVITNSVNTLV